MSTLSIKLGPTEQKKNFKTKESLEAFFTQEKEFWQSFFTERAIARPLNISTSQINNNLNKGFTSAQRIIDSIDISFENIKQEQKKLEYIYLNYQLLSSKSSYAKWVENEVDVELSIYMIGAYLEKGFENTLYENNGHINGHLRSIAHIIIKYISEATSKKVLFEVGFTSNIESEKNALGEMKEELGEVISRGEIELETIKKVFSDEKNNIEFCKDKTQQKLNINTKLFDRFMKKSKNNMKDFEDFYEKKLAMQSAVKYWHDKKIIAYWVVGILSVIVLVVGGFGVSYLFGISETIGNNLLDLNTTSALNGSRETIKYLPILHFAIISTFVIWFLRILVKIFLSKLHSAEVASEREMFIKSYLALMNEHEGSIVDENDRQLILQSIFRPTSDGYISEEGPKITDIMNFIGRTKG